MLKTFIKNVFGNKRPTAAATILVVDDTDSDRHLSQGILEKQGYKTIAASDGRAGVDLARQSKPSLILMDYMMPDLNGVDACQILKNDPQTRDIPVIFLTSLDTPNSVVECFEQGADIFLAKPVNTNDLIKQVEITLADKGRL